MQNTTNLNLKKPDQTDYVNISDINDNMDVIDAALVKKYEKPSTGIPKTDLTQNVQSSLEKAETALQKVDKSSVGLGNVDNTSDANKPISTATQSALDLKAPLASPVFTGAPTAPTPAESTNNTQIATTEFVQKKVAAHQTDYVSHPGVGTTTNTGNAYAVTLNPAPTSYVDKMGLIVTINADSTGPSTINANSLGAKSVKKANGNDVTNFKKDGVYSLRYNASTENFILQGEGGEYGTVTASDVRKTKTFGTDNGVVQGNLDLTNLIASNIKKGITIDGVIGTLDIASLGGYTYASGSGLTLSSITRNVITWNGITGYNAYYYTISGLSFKPKIIIIYNYNSSNVSPTIYKSSGLGYGGDTFYSYGGVNETTDALMRESYGEINNGYAYVPYKYSYGIPQSHSVSMNWIAIG